MKAPTLEPTPGGFRVRLRVGSGQRLRVTIPLTDERSASHRATQLHAMAQALVRAKQTAKARLVLEQAAAAPTEAGFKSIAAVAAELCRRAGAPEESPRSLTFRELGEQWVSGELARRFPDHVKVKRERSTDDDRLRLTRLCATIGDVPLVAFRIEDAERAMAALPGGRRPATRRHYGQIIARILKLAVYPLRIIPSSPIPEGFLPKLGLRPAFSFLYPSEDAQLLACADVPLEMRLLYGFLAREGCRLSEALALRWRDFDLTRGIVSIGRTKTDNGRSWALGEGVAEALSSSRGEAKDEALVFPPVNVDRAADGFRAHLLAAHVDRPELHERTDTRRPIRAHDLRATFITLSLANGRTEAWVMDRTGHTTSAMLNRYRRAARFATEVGLGPLKPLNEALGVGQKVGQGSGNEDDTNTTKGELNQMLDTHTERVARVGLELCRRTVKNAGRRAADVSGWLRRTSRTPPGWHPRSAARGRRNRPAQSFWPAETVLSAREGGAGAATGCSGRGRPRSGQEAAGRMPLRARERMRAARGGPALAARRWAWRRGAGRCRPRAQGSGADGPEAANRR
jgi:integrase